MRSVGLLISFIIMLRSSVFCWKFSNLNARCNMIPISHRLWGSRSSSTISIHTSTLSGGINIDQQGNPMAIYELRKRLEVVPQQPGVYMFRDENGKLLYVGKSVNLFQRVRSYFRKLPSLEDLHQNPNKFLCLEPASSLGRRQSAMVKLIRSLETMVTFDAGEALMLEASLVRTRQPPFNVLLKDDSTHYPYLCITWSKPYPQFYVTSHKFMSRKNIFHKQSTTTKKKNVIDDSSPWPTHDVYLGPFVEGSSLKRLLALVKESFPLRQRWYPLYPDKTCLNYDIGRCPGVCQGLISPDDYRNTIGEAQMVFEGRSQLILDKLEARLNHAVKTEAFELADTIYKQIERLKSGGLLGSTLPFDCDNTKNGGPTCDVWAIAMAPHSITKEEEKEEEVGKLNGENKELSNRLACIQLFQIRKGRVEHRLGWSLNHLGLEIEEWEVLSQVMTQYYGESSHTTPCPSTIITSTQLPPLVSQELEVSFTSQRSKNQHFSDVTSVVEKRDSVHSIDVETSPNGKVRILCPISASLVIDQEISDHNSFMDQENNIKDEHNKERYHTYDDDDDDDNIGTSEDIKNLVKLTLHNAQAELVRIGGRNRLIDTALDSIASLLNVQFSEEASSSSGNGRRIEGLDISHTGGSHRVASFVVFIDGKVSKRHHRTFMLNNNDDHRAKNKHDTTTNSTEELDRDITTTTTTTTTGIRIPQQGIDQEVNDDCRSIREAVRIRFGYYEGHKSDIILSKTGNSISSQNIIFPNLLLVDGGKGQLNAAMMGLNDCGLINDEGVILNNMVVCSLAKKREEIFVINQTGPLHLQTGELSIPNSPAMILLRQVRDEAHRIAVNKHRKKRDYIDYSSSTTAALLSKNITKRISNSSYDDTNNISLSSKSNSSIITIPGVRVGVFDKLVSRFGSLEGISQATSEELLSIPGVGPITELKIREHFSHNEKT